MEKHIFPSVTPTSFESLLCVFLREPFSSFQSYPFFHMFLSIRLTSSPRPLELSFPPQRSFSYYFSAKIPLFRVGAFLYVSTVDVLFVFFSKSFFFPQPNSL